MLWYKTRDETTINAKYVVLGVGRPGSDWCVRKTLRRYGVKFKNNRVDVGVRVETNNIIMDEINQNLYEESLSIELAMVHR